MYTWFDKFMILVSMGGLLLFCGIVAYYVATPDLIIVMAVVLGLAIHDFWISVFRKKKPSDEQ